jgi:hypothetical protein
VTENEHGDQEQGLAALDRAILPRAVMLFVVAAAVAIAGEMLAPGLLESPNIAIRCSGAIASALSTGAVCFAFMGLAVAAAAAASQASRRLRAYGVSPLTIRTAVVLLLGALIVGLFLFLPFCLGSLHEGTYDCIPLATRLARWLGRGPK